MIYNKVEDSTFSCKCKHVIKIFGFLIKIWTKENKWSFTVLLSLSSPQSKTCVLAIFKSLMLKTFLNNSSML